MLNQALSAAAQARARAILTLLPNGERITARILRVRYGQVTYLVRGEEPRIIKTDEILSVQVLGD